MNLQALLGEMPKQQFVAEHYQRLPFSHQGGAAAVAHLATWDTLVDIVTRPEADVLIVRQGAPYDGPPPRTVADAQRLSDEGYTFRVRKAEQQHPGIGELAAAFAADFGGPVDVHLYCTPAQQFGLSWHYDIEEVFILQTTGRKLYSLRKNTVNPWPTAETMPTDLRYEREIMPLQRCELAGGDWLYIPSGYWHMGEASEPSISLSVGVLPKTGIDVFDFLRRQILESYLWRQRLPTLGEASALSEAEQLDAYRHLFAELAKDLNKSLASDRTLKTFLK